jgi:hypothetical protein
MLLASELKPKSKVPSAFIRARLMCAIPFTELKAPPMTIFPSVCTAALRTWPLTSGLNPRSTEPSAFNRAMRLRVVPPTMVKPPPMTIFSSDWIATQ